MDAKVYITAFFSSFIYRVIQSRFKGQIWDKFATNLGKSTINRDSLDHVRGLNERKAKFEIASWAPLAQFIIERELSAARIS